jgi:hypothetical protein
MAAVVAVVVRFTARDETGRHHPEMLIAPVLKPIFTESYIFS